MNLRKVSIMLAAPVLILVAGLSAWLWLMHSESGARWLLSRLDSTLAGSIGSSAITGDLGSGLLLAGFYYDDGSTRVDVHQLTIAVDVDLLPPAVGIETLQARAVHVQVLPSSASASGQETDWEHVIQGYSLPVPLTIEDVRISDLEYVADPGNGPVVIQSIVAAGSLHDELVLDRLSISVQDQELALSGYLGLAAPQPLSIEFQASGDLELEGSLEGNLESATILLDSANPRLRVSGTLAQLLQTPGWNLEISSPEIQWPLDEQEPATKLVGVKAHSSGEWNRFHLELVGQLELDGLEPSRLELAGSGTNSHFEASKLLLDGPDLSLRASGMVSWRDELLIGLDTILERLNPGKWLDEWPENKPLSGTLALVAGGTQLRVSDLNLSVADTGVSATGQGVFDIESGIVDGVLNWSDFSWPPGDAQPLVASKEGSFRISGEPENWSLDGMLVLQARELPEGRLRMSGTGDQDSLDVTIHEGDILGGSLSGDIAWNWKENQPFALELAFDRINFSPLLPQYPGMLSARLRSTGQLEPLSFSAEIQQLDGTIMDLPVSAEGGFHFAHKRVYADALNLRSGASSLFLNGSLYEAGGIEFSANIDSLQRFIGEAKGSFSTQGTVSLHPENPKFSATITGQQLSYGPIEIANIETRRRTEPGTEPGTEVIFTSLVIGQRPVESLLVRFSGQQPLQGVTVNTNVEGTELNLVLNGSVNDWSDPLASGWSGLLSELRIDHLGKFVLELEAATPLEWSSLRSRLEQLCLSGTRQAKLCFESSWSSPDEIDISANLASVPVGLLELFIDTDVRFTQNLSGTLNWSQTKGGNRSGGANIEMSPGAILDADDDEMLFETGSGLLSFELGRGQLRQGNLDISFPGSGDIDLDFSVTDLNLGLDSPVQGTVSMDLSDIGAIGMIMPLFDTIDGILDLDLALSGTLADPAFKGKAVLTNGTLENHASGFSFTGINLASEVTDQDRSELSGNFRAGEGDGAISASIDFEDISTPVINLALQGESLTLIEVPDLKVIANPDMTLSWQNETLEINGRLHIPVARLAPSYLPQSSVVQSKDVVVVAGELPAEKEESRKASTISIRGNLEVELGDEVVVDLELAQISVTGMSQFSWQDKLIPVANGNFDVSGDIQAYGQSLRVTQGRIGFPGIPADNPHLNIRAEREIFGNSQIRRAGMMVTGTLRRPVIEPYTIPMTNKERARTLLVTGSDFNYEQGVGAVDVGMYVLPRLHISYGIGIFEEGNVLKARFDLGRGFGIRATSGQRETGLDISYTIER